MAEKRNQIDFLQKAAMYELLADYYRYSNPNLHIHYYLKHMKNTNKALDIMSNITDINKRVLHADANIRFLHAVYDAHKVDLYVNNKPFASNVPFQKVSDYVSLQPGQYSIEIFSSEEPAKRLLNNNMLIEAGKIYTIAAVGLLEKVNLLTVENRPSVPLGESKMRFLHLATDTPSLDLAVKDRDVVFPNISFQQATDYLGLTPMTVDLELRTAGRKEVILPMPKLQFKANETYTVVLFGLEKELSISVIKD
ncbi:DUF4397 domain-containing protein [Bacillus sp. EB600]|uniref:DUF4397 domain-containing protein n=1 Tax=Bacillus sp. EB600 TaxID=2806345 RepID=UPI00210CF672|nr:DUF4397 domain-containing protein [Bacillus sp. EB600]MCQ6277809.1 DUF4397 domain-containing protein [Bacillus sp. EB600]